MLPIISTFKIRKFSQTNFHFFDFFSILVLIAFYYRSKRYIYIIDNHYINVLMRNDFKFHFCPIIPY